MPYYQYKGRTKYGELIKGVLEAASEVTVASHLQRLEITPVDIQPTAKPMHLTDVMRWFALSKIKDTDLCVFARQMQSLLKSSVPFNRAIGVVIESSKNQMLRDALTKVLLDLESGYPIARCFQNQDTLFPAFFTAMIDVGEKTGRLGEVFGQIHRFMENEIITKKRLKSAARYPLIVLVAILFALVLMNFFVIPAFRGFFDSMEASLPWATLWLIGFSDFCVQHAWAILFVGCSLVASISLSLSFASVRLRRDKWMLRLPIIGSLMHRAMMARFARSLSMAYQSGLPLDEAILVVAKSTNNLYMTQAIRRLTKGIEHGELLSQVGKRSGLFSPITIQMIAIAEETGQVTENLIQVAQFYEEDVDYDIKRMNDLLEPILIGIIALMVLVLALGVFLPLWDLSSVMMSKIRS